MGRISHSVTSRSHRLGICAHVSCFRLRPMTPCLLLRLFPGHYNIPFISFPAVTTSPSSHPGCPPSSHFLALAGNEPPQWIAINGAGGGGGGSLMVDKDTPVSTTQQPVFPLDLLLKWGTNLGHIKSSV